MKTILILGILLMTLAVYLHSTNLKDYDKEPDIDTTYPHTWLVRDSIQKTYKAGIDTGKAVDETKK